MPSRKNKTKATGDTHLPDVESEFSVEQRRTEQDQQDKAEAAGARPAGDTSRDAGGKGADKRK